MSLLLDADRSCEAPTGAPDIDAGVIEEARARQRRRRWAGAASLAAAAVVASVVLAMVGGGVSRPGGVPPSRSAGGRATIGKHSTFTVAKCVLARPPHPTTAGAPDQTWLALLGVLRRAQRATDAIPARSYLSYNQEVFVRYIRRARVLGSSAYWVWPATITRCGGAKPYQGLMFFTGSLARGRPAGGGAGETLAQFKQYGDFFSHGGSGETTVVGLVPDEVTSVTLHYRAANGHPALQLTGKVVHNVAVVSVPFSAGGALAASMTWTGAHGQVIKTLPSW